MALAEENKIYLVTGCSMNPLLRVGDRVELVPVTRQEVQVGDILVFISAEGGHKIHRVISNNPLRTKGDNSIFADNPIPAEQQLYRAVCRIRNGAVKRLTSGRTGYWQFCRHQCRMHFLRGVIRVLSRLARLNIFRVSSSRLTCALFQERRVYYAGDKPVGWYDKEGWHWIGLAYLYVQQPKR